MENISKFDVKGAINGYELRWWIRLWRRLCVDRCSVHSFDYCRHSLRLVSKKPPKSGGFAVTSDKKAGNPVFLFLNIKSDTWTEAGVYRNSNNGYHDAFNKVEWQNSQNNQT